MNSIIEYLYRDASNNKVWNTYIVAGLLTEEEFAQMRSCCEDQELFIPEAVGMTTKTFEDLGYSFSEQDDGAFFELCSMEETQIEALENALSKEQLMENFRRMKGKWAEYAYGNNIRGAATHAVSAMQRIANY